MIDRRSLVGAGAAMTLAGPLLAADRSLDVALVNGHVWTGVPGIAMASAIGIVGAQIVAVGAGPVQARTGRSTRVIDLKGAFVTPGFIDNHTHFLVGSAELSQPNLLDSGSREAFARCIAAAARARPGQWILGGSWDEQRLGGTLPTREWIDAVTPDTPVAVPRTDLHMYLVNSVALRLAGITRDTPDPAGGVIDRDARGEPTGIIKDNAKDLIQRVIPPPTDAEQDTTLRAGIAHGLSRGVTQVHCPEIN
jgi:predicted amidohydrolase YtcJ